MEAAQRGVENFHLTFLGQLGSQLDKRIYAVKGGCNLRFFFDSPRMSEDLDLDVSEVAEGTLKNKVDRILSGRPLSLILRGMRMTIEAVSTPKQTPTTQRWKVALLVGGEVGHTKIEFSRRGLDADVDFARAAVVLSARYGLSPPFLSHYSATSAIAQKVRALAGRPQTQARDIFDLDWLIQRGRGSLASLSPDLTERAVERASQVTFGEFKAQVVSYLAPREQALYDSETLFNDMVLRCLEALEKRA
jgi:predicted nucleotidyltransferase component of viral defense system